MLYMTYIFKKGQDYDGTLIEHVLDYYIPEWRHLTGNILSICSGTSIDGEGFICYLNPDRSSILRYQVVGDYATVHKVTDPSKPKKDILTLYKDGDVYDDKTDRRFLEMLKDYHEES